MSAVGWPVFPARQLLRLQLLKVVHDMVLMRAQGRHASCKVRGADGKPGECYLNVAFCVVNKAPQVLV